MEEDVRGGEKVPPQPPPYLPSCVHQLPNICNNNGRMALPGFLGDPSGSSFSAYRRAVRRRGAVWNIAHTPHHRR